MDIERYSIQFDSSYLLYKFQSIGPKGIIEKVVQYEKGRINDLIVSNNNDTYKILSTIGQTILQFVSHFPNANILIVGSTNSRTRLYQMAINQNIKEIDELFDVDALKNDHWEKFKAGKNF